jgi:ABC-2 type transport system ATP-binding protein
MNVSAGPAGARESAAAPGTARDTPATVPLSGVASGRAADQAAGWAPGGSPAAAADAGAAPLQSVPGGRPAPDSPAVYTNDLRKHYRNTSALSGLTMTVGRGEVFGFLGPNGAGKTTTVKLLLGLIAPTSGEAMVLGAPAGDRETRRRIGYLPELFRFQAWLEAREVLELHRKLLGMPRGGSGAAIEAALETVGLAARAGDKVGTFSKGMQQRLGLAVALLGEPELVFLDEPTSALDPVGRHDVRQIVRDLRAAGTTVFLNTHLLEEAEQVCDRVAVVDRGRCIATGTLTEILGGEAVVRLKVGGLEPGWWRQLEGFGRFAEEGSWVVLEHAQVERVPELVAAIVARGGAIEAVVPEHHSLEERFLDLLGAE